ncbi:substrate-binding periplasmic protein [Chitinimonas naiadis]
MRYTLLMLPCLLASPLWANELKICVDSNEWAPYTYPNRDGTLQTLVRMTASRLGHKVILTALPWRRCQTDVETGRQDGMLAVATTDYALANFSFPRRGPAIDTARAVVSAPYVLLRKTGSLAYWNGRQIVGLQGPVLYPHGYADIAARLKQLAVAGESGATTNEQNARKILAGRAELMAVYLGDANRLLAMPEFAGTLEALPEPLGESLSYLAVGKSFYAQNTAAMEQFWTELSITKQSDAYRQAITATRD